jgi:hypothetical protein
VAQSTSVGQNDDLLPSTYTVPIPLPSTQQVDDLAYLLKKGRVERLCLLPLTFGKIAIEGSIFENDRPVTLGGRGYSEVIICIFEPWT